MKVIDARVRNFLRENEGDFVGSYENMRVKLMDLVSGQEEDIITGIRSFLNISEMALMSARSTGYDVNAGFEAKIYNAVMAVRDARKCLDESE